MSSTNFNNKPEKPLRWWQRIRKGFGTWAQNAGKNLKNFLINWGVVDNTSKYDDLIKEHKQKAEENARKSSYEDVRGTDKDPLKGYNLPEPPEPGAVMQNPTQNPTQNPRKEERKTIDQLLEEVNAANDAAAAEARKAAEKKVGRSLGKA